MNAAHQLGIPSDELVYAFDVIVRGHQYRQEAAKHGCLYQPHPLRESCGRFDKMTIYETEGYSNGKQMLAQIGAGELSPDPASIARYLRERKEAAQNERRRIFDAVRKDDPSWKRFAAATEISLRGPEHGSVIALDPKSPEFK